MTLTKKIIIGLISVLSVSSAAFYYADKSSVPQNIGGSVLKVTQGGTGATTFDVGECLYGNGTGAIYSDACAAGSMTALPSTQIYVGNASNVATATSSVTVSTAGVLSASGGTSLEWTTAYSWGDHASALYLTQANASSSYLGYTFTTATSTNTLFINQICNTAGQCFDSPGTEGIGITFYPNNDDADIATYENLFTYPSEGMSVDESCSADADVAGGYCLIDTYVSSSSDISILNYPAGTTRIHAYTYVSSAAGTSKLVFNGYRRDAGGTEYFLGQATSTEIDNLTEEEIQATFASTVDTAFNQDGTDRLVVKVYGHTDSTAARDVHWMYQSSGLYSHIATPITSADLGHARIYANETITGAWDFSNGIDVTGNITATNLVATSVNRTIYIDPTADGDFGTRMNAAYAALPSYGGRIKVMPGDPGTWAVPIVFATAGKPVILECDPGGVTTFNYTGTATSTSFNIGNYENIGFYGVVGCNFQGASSTGTTVGIQIGGTQGARNFLMQNTYISGFGLGLSIQNISYLVTVEKSSFIRNGVNLRYSATSNAGEQMRFNNNIFADNTYTGGTSPAEKCVWLDAFGAASVSFVGNSFDDCQLYIGAGSRNVNINGGHFENPAGDTLAKYIPLIIADSDYTNVTITGATFFNGADTETPEHFILNGANLSIYGVTAINNGGGAGSDYFIKNQGEGARSIIGLINTDSAFAFVEENTGSGEAFIMTEGGNVGIGTTSPDGMLTVEGGYGGQFKLRSALDNGESSLQLLSKDDPTWDAWLIGKNVGGLTSDQFSFYKNGLKMTLTDDGKLGIGTSTPSGLLTIGAGMPGANFTVNSTGGASSTQLSVSGTSWFSGLLTAVNETLTGLLTTVNATITGILKIPNGTANLTGSAGEIGVDTTTGQFRWNTGTATGTLPIFKTLSFSYATSTAWSGTTTLYLAPSMGAITVQGAYCETNTGTVGVSLYDGTNRANTITTASSTINYFNYSTNNSFTAGESMRVDVGAPASSPTKVSCRFKYIYDAD